MLKTFIIYLILFNSLILSAKEVDLKNKVLKNATAYITSQCYTKTQDPTNKNILHNPCYSCHTKNKIPNYTYQDDDLQTVYDFPSFALENHWSNLFKDRTEAVKQISDKKILKYISQNNYERNNKIILQQKLARLPKKWDFNNNGKWDGYIPDCYFHFDNKGFDKDPKGDYTGWRAFAYRPFLGTFWPTNGSTDDVIIRLPKEFREDMEGNFDLKIYKLNLSIIESLIKQKDVKIDPVDEKKYGFDLNKDGKLDTADKIVFIWNKPEYDIKTDKIKNFSMSYVGKAKQLLENNDILIAPGLYPVGTEFLHTVRYIGINKKNEITIASRMKELRYGKKIAWISYGKLKSSGLAVLKEKDDFPDRVEQFIGNSETGVWNHQGWVYQGFIEDAKGELRPQSYEETLYCMGCHDAIGATADSTFAFQRKLSYNHFQKGWYHWNQKGLKGISDRILKNGDTEYVQYLKTNNAGDEFRQNQEIIEKFFQKGWEKDTKNIEKDLAQKYEHPNIYQKQAWKLKQDEVKKLKNDISYLLLPSIQRAISLNKAYKVIVDEQSYIYGRGVHIKPLYNVHKKVTDGQATHLYKVDNE